MNTLQIPFPVNWQPRAYQIPLWNALTQDGVKRACVVWHRRAGKDTVSMNWSVLSAMTRPGLYYHMLPTLTQARRVIWDGKSKEGRPFMSYFPEPVVKSQNTTDMKVILRDELGNSIWQLAGSDNFDRLVGTNPLGVTFSEWSLADPMAWEFVRPILLENEGWACFIFTPRGRNHAHELFQRAKDNPAWYCQRLTVEDTGMEHLVERARAEGMSDQMIQQEFYCSFDAPLEGSYFGPQMMRALQDGRISEVPYDSHVPVETWWDLGIGDKTAVWFAQRVGHMVHLIDYYENDGEPLAHYVSVLDRKRTEWNAIFSDHVLPHDVRARDISIGKSRETVLRELGLKPTVLPPHRVEDGIEMARALIDRCRFDEKKCERGISCLRSYRKEQESEDKWESPTIPTYKDRPLHDWASHGADAFRYGAMHTPSTKAAWKPIKYATDGSEFH